ncbi:hypothetical protein CALCODRAFT_197492 [Calocera cornea HHB12733]|uniref:Uncharacterized protein n=1 Tax=Calocera cornea HHB12733 TaxID=1353952 RepID=A0A165C5Y1_9BASI|nr:hypothetical protein CALCODRAFT_197492 [Calocera cornea HHB12733]
MLPRLSKPRPPHLRRPFAAACLILTTFCSRRATQKQDGVSVQQSSDAMSRHCRVTDAQALPPVPLCNPIVTSSGSLGVLHGNRQLEECLQSPPYLCSERSDQCSNVVPPGVPAVHSTDHRAPPDPVLLRIILHSCGPIQILPAAFDPYRGGNLRICGSAPAGDARLAKATVADRQHWPQEPRTVHL